MMKIEKYARLASLAILIFSGCNEKEDNPVPDSSERIIFSTPSLSMSVETRSEFRNELREGDVFGVMGYCIPYNNTSENKVLAYGSASSNWSVKREFSTPDVFFKQRVLVGSEGCTYNGFGSEQVNNPKYWYSDGHDVNNNENPQVQEADNYTYSFFAYYPYNAFEVISPVSATNPDAGHDPETGKAIDIGAPVLEFTMPQENSDDLDDELTPDAMLGIQYNVRNNARRVSFNMSHVLTGLGFVVNNLSDADELKIYSLKLTGKFFKKVRIDFSNDIVSYTFPDDRYEGTYVLYDWGEDSPLVMPASAEGSYFEDYVENIKYLLLISGEGEYFGEDVEVVIDYEFRGERKTVSRSRPGTFTPSPGYRYTAQLNFIGDAFVLQFVVDNSETWEDGELADGDDSNDDIIFE